MNKKVVIGVAVLIILVLIGVGIYRQFSKKQEKEVIKIGAILPLTGKFSFYGNEVKNGLTLVQKNDSSLNFIFEDNLSQANISVTAMNKLLEDPNISIIFSSNSPLSLPLRPIAGEKKRVLIALVTGAKDFGVENEWCYRDAINQDQEGVAQAKYIFHKTTYRKAAILCVNDDYGLSGAASFHEMFERLGGTVVSLETFEMNTADMKNQVVKLMNYEPDFILTIGREQTLITAINQIRDFNKAIPIITSDSFESKNVMEGITTNAIGIIFTSYQNDLTSKRAKTFIDNYLKQFNYEPGIYAIDAFVAGSYIAEIIKRSNDPDSIRIALSNLIYESDIKGVLKTDDKRNIVSPIAVYRINDKMQKEQISIIE